MVYAEVFNMTMSPDDYIGKIIRMTVIYIMITENILNMLYHIMALRK